MTNEQVIRLESAIRNQHDCGYYLNGGGTLKETNSDISFLIATIDALRSQKDWCVCDEHQWPYGVDLEGDNRPHCVWCEALRADELERKVVEIRNQFNVAVNLLNNATPNPKFLTMGYQKKWAQEFGKLWAWYKFKMG